MLAGIVLDETGLPLSDVPIEAKQRYGSYYRERVKTDAAGRFRLTCVPRREGGADSWTIKAVARSSGGSEILGSVSGIPLGTEDITIVARRPTFADAFVSGLLVFPGQELPANVEVAIYRLYDPEPRVRSSSFIDVDRRSGAFRHGPLPAGEYRIVARRKDEVIGTLEGIVIGSGETIIAPDLKIDL